VGLDWGSIPSFGTSGRTGGNGLRHGINGNKTKVFACKCWGQKVINGKGLRKDVRTRRRRVIVNLCNDLE
jgi:hypothetical protein